MEERLHANTRSSSALVAAFFETKIVGVFCMHSSTVAVSVPLSRRCAQLTGTAAQVPEQRVKKPTMEAARVNKLGKTNGQKHESPI